MEGKNFSNIIHQSAVNNLTELYIFIIAVYQSYAATLTTVKFMLMHVQNNHLFSFIAVLV